jgi:glycosyltransferase involved in cell wall biosynthesis
MRICLVSREYPTDEWGGIGTYTEKTARALVQLGQTVDVITEGAEGPSTRTEDGVTVHRLAPQQRFVGIPNTKTLSRSRAVAEAVARLPAPHIVQVCENGAEGIWYSLRRRSGTGLVTRLATPTAVVAELSAHAEPEPLKVRALDALERVQTRRSDAVLCPSAALAELVSRRWGLRRERITIMPTGVDFAERYAPCAKPLPAELRGRDYLLYVGRLEERKGVHVLARALPRILGVRPDLRAVFVGSNFLAYDGRSMQAFIEECNWEYRDRLHFFASLRPTELHPIYANALVAVFPSLWESVPNVALEALDMGKPVVGTRGSGIGEVVEDGRSGILVPPGDAGALRDGLETLLANRDLLGRMSQAATARARDFSQDAMAGRLLDFYAGLGTVAEARAT